MRTTLPVIQPYIFSLVAEIALRANTPMRKFGLHSQSSPIHQWRYIQFTLTVLVRMASRKPVRKTPLPAEIRT